MKTIMVTGGRGMLGHAVEQVVGDEPRAGSRFDFVDIEEGDLTDKVATRALFERVRPHVTLQARRIYLPSLKIGNRNYNCYLVFGRFPAELGPETRSNGSGSKNGAERTQN